jgi:hypothetical protein
MHFLGLHSSFLSVSGGVVNSTVVPQVQAVFPQGALTKKIKVGLQVNMFRPRRLMLGSVAAAAAAQNGKAGGGGAAAAGGGGMLLKKITVNHIPKKKRFSLIW